MIELKPLKEITVEITWQCLQDCVHCSSGASSRSEEILSKDEIIAIAHDFKKLGGKKIELSGGEPLLHKDIGYILDALKKLGLQIHIFTCGSISKDANYNSTMQETAQMLSDKGVDKVVFSLHGANARTHDEIARSPGSFRRAVEFIEELIQRKVVVGIHFVPMSLNFEEFRDLVDFTVQLKVNDVSILRFVPQGRGEKNKESLMLNKLEVARLVELLAEEKKKRKIVKIGSHLDFTFLIDGSVPKPCTAGVTKCLIEANGKIIPCAVFKGMTDKEENNFVAGDIRKESLSDVWAKSKIFEKLRKFNPKDLQGSCSLCEYLSVCKGRCPAQRIYDHSDFYMGPDNYCPKEIFSKNSLLGS